jgi:HlyD family secretion protein
MIRERDRVNRLLEKKAATPKQLDDINGEIEVMDKRMEAIRSSTQIANRSILAEKEPLIAQIAVLNNQIKKSYIYNTVDGTILTKLTEPNEFVGMGSPIYRIGELDTMTLRFYASSLQLQEVKLGQKIEVLIDKGADNYSTLEGTISWVSEQSEFTPKTIQTKEDRVNLVYAVKAKVANPEGFLKIGMPAEVNFNQSNSEGKNQEAKIKK